MRLLPSRALAANKAWMCQDYRGLSVSVMSDRHHQQRKSATAFHLLTKAVTDKLLQTNGTGVRGGMRSPDKGSQCNWQLGRASSSLATHGFREAADALPRAGRALCVRTSLEWAHAPEQPQVCAASTAAAGTCLSPAASRASPRLWCWVLSYRSSRSFTPEESSSTLLRAKLLSALVSRLSCPKLKVGILSLQHPGLIHI